MSDCERHPFSLRNVKNAGIPCPFCRAERAEGEREEAYLERDAARKERDEAWHAVLYMAPIYYGDLPDHLKALINRARAAGEEGKR